MGTLENLSLEELAELWNDSTPISAELDCQLQQYKSSSSKELICAPVWDSLLCWPATAAGSLSVQPCFDELNGIKYDTTSKFEWDPV